MSVIVAGHVCVDLVPDLPDGIDIRPGRLRDVGRLGLRLGGSVANTGRALTRLGVETSAWADIGDDALADIAVDLAAGDGLPPDGFRRVPGESTSYSIVVEPPGVDRSFWHHAGTNDAFIGAGLDADGAQIVHVGYPPLLAALRTDDGAALRSLFAAATRSGAATSLDLAVVDPVSPAGRVDWRGFLDAVLPLTDVVSPSIDDLRSMGSADPVWAASTPEAVALDLVRRGAAVAMVSSGGDGLTLAVGDAERLLRVPSLAYLSAWAGRSFRVAARRPDHIVTTNGAGDAATAGLLAALLAARTPLDALGLAADSAADAIAGHPDRSMSRGSAR